MRRDWWAPLTGVAFVVLLIIGLIVGGEPPDATDEVQEIVDFYVDDKDKIQLGGAISIIATSLLVWFGAVLRNWVRTPDGRGRVLGDVLFAGTIIAATGSAIDGTISFALAEAAEDIDPTAVQALQALWDNDWMPLALGLQLFLLASGLALLRHTGVLKVLGWIGVLLGIVALTPVGFVAFLAGGVWLIVLSVILTLQRRSEADPTAPPPTQPVGVTR
jgi:hypothetical protein